MPEARGRRADVRVAVVAVDAPGLQHPVRVAVLARTADVVHQFVPAAFLDRGANAAADVAERLVPRDARPLACAALARAAQGIQDAVGILELVRRDDALGARAAAAARVHRVAFDLADLQ